MTRSETRVFHVDPEHTALRLAVVVILFLALLLSYLAVRGLLALFAPDLGSPGLLACLGALPLGLFAAWLVESGLKRNWHSGQRLLLENGRLLLEGMPGADETLHLDEPLQQLWWSFPLSGYPRGGRERRMPSTWSCVAGQLHQDGSRIIPFCFAPPRRVAAWEADYDFAQLQPGDVYDNSLSARMTGPARPEIPAEIVAGEQGRFWLAERNRWQEGVELTPDDFEALLHHLQDLAANHQPPTNYQQPPTTN